MVGVGGMGSAALYHLARAGLRVVGLERFDVAHDRGSSHGESRILRLAYFEDPGYVPLARRALELWHALERESGERLFVTTGGLDGGSDDSPIFQGALAACRAHGLDHEVMDGAELRKRFGAFRFPRSHRFVFQPDAGSLHPETCIEAHTRMAEAMGAELRTHTRVEGWESDAGGVDLHLEGGGRLRADQVVFAAGAWSAGLLPEGAPRLRVERQVVGWLAPDDPADFDPSVFPVFNVDIAGGHQYGFPALHGRGPKIGRFGHLQETVDPDALRRDATAADRELLQGFADLHLRRAGTLVECVPCMFTYSLDTHFVVDRVPGRPVVAACGFSGHGFKFAPAVGEAVARLVVGDDPGEPFSSLFRWDRFADGDDAGA